MLIPDGKEQVILIDNLTNAQADKVRDGLARYFEDYEFLKLYEGSLQYCVVVRAGIITTDREDQMTFFALGITYGME